MNKKDISQQLSVFVQAGEVKEAFEFLNHQDLDASTKNSCSIIQAEYQLLREDERRGTISYEERQMRRNRINEKLLKLLQDEPSTGVKSYLASPLLKVLIPLVLLTAATLIWWRLSFNPYSCPDFPAGYNNKVMVLPFQKAGSQEAEPELILREKINKITTKNGLSTKAEIGTFIKNLSREKAVALSKQCEADLIVWGTYSQGTDSLRFIINYHFSQNGDWNKAGELFAVKDVMELYNGQMLKDMEDAIMSLCGLIAIKEGNGPLAKKWFDKVKHPEELDNKMVELLK